MSATNAWDKLNCYYKKESQNTIVYLIKEIFCASFSDEMPMGPQLNDVQHKVYILKILSKPISDTVITYAMLFAFPNSYSTLCTILNSTPATTGGLSLSTDIVITQVLTEEKNIKLGSLQVALIAYTKGKRKPQLLKLSDRDKRKIKCNYCEKKGYIKSECWKFKMNQARKEEKSGEKKDSGSLAIQSRDLDWSKGHIIEMDC